MKGYVSIPRKKQSNKGTAEQLIWVLHVFIAGLYPLLWNGEIVGRYMTQMV